MFPFFELPRTTSGPGCSAQGRSAEPMEQSINVAEIIEAIATAAAQASSLAEPWIQANLVKPDSAAKNNGETHSVSTTCNKFEVKIDVTNFVPEEINVKVVNNSIVIEAKHEEKEDKYGFISRQFVRRFILPEGVILEKMNCKMNPDNTILISAPRRVEKPNTNDRTIPINFIGQNSQQTSATEETNSTPQNISD